MKKVLLLVEGAKNEKEILEKVLAEYKLGLDEPIIYPYETNIYELYERMFLGNEDDLENLDLLSVLRKKDRENKDLYNDFSDILLIFDYEPQDDRFSKERLNLMLEYFNESTENGKLFINYPTVESYKHFKTYPEDKEYKDRKVPINQIGKKYKGLVDKDVKHNKDLRKFTKDMFNSIIKQNIKKANYILNNNYELQDEKLKDTYLKLNNKEIAKKQSKFMEEEQVVYVLNTMLFFICDYNFNLIYDYKK